METLYKVFVSIIPPVVGILVYVFIESKRKARTKTMPVQNAETLLDDVSYIQEIKHLHGAVGIAFWKQYDVLLAAQHYGWETMVDWAAYMESADIDKIDSIAVADLNDDTGIELAHVYNLNKVGLKNFERLVEEHGILSIAGHRLFTHINDETLVTKYVETIIRRTFGTKDAMKLAKPVPKNNNVARN